MTYNRVGKCFLEQFIPRSKWEVLQNLTGLRLSNYTGDLGDRRKYSRSFQLYVQLQHGRQTGCRLH